MEFNISMINDNDLYEKVEEMRKNYFPDVSLNVSIEFEIGKGVTYTVLHNDEIIFKSAYKSRAYSFLLGIEYIVSL